MIADMIGMHWVWEHTERTGVGPFARMAIGRGTRRLVDRHVIDPTTVQSLGTGEAVLMTKVPTAAATLIRVNPPPRPRAAGTIRTGAGTTRDGTSATHSEAAQPASAARTHRGQKTRSGSSKQAHGRTHAPPDIGRGGRAAPPDRGGSERG
jgi:hypothetical protein